MASPSSSDQAPDASASQGHQWYLPPNTRKQVQELFEQLKDPVELWLFAKPGEEGGPYAQYMRRFGADMALLAGGRLRFFEKGPDSEEARRFEVGTLPTLLVQPGAYAMRFVGAPAGEEGRVLMEALIMASSSSSFLSEKAKGQLAALKEPRQVQVFVSPTCPYCPTQAGFAFKAAVERPELVKAEVIDIQQAQELAKEHEVTSVPYTLINGELAVLGLETESVFFEELVTLVPNPAEEPGRPGTREGETASKADLVIIGAGPAGLTAAVYAGRAGLSAVVLEQGVLGGQVSLTPKVENYPGFLEIPGMALSSVMAEQAGRYASVKTGQQVTEIKIGKRVEVFTEAGAYEAQAVLLATGASWKKLGVPGEDRLTGKGVSYCATCDGFFYKDGTVVVVGGGNTALTDAVHLAGLGAKVSLVHRRPEFRAEDYLQKALESAGIQTYLGYTVEEILGRDKVEGVRLRSTKDNSSQELKLDGVFVAIGNTANTELARQLGLRLTTEGAIWVDRRMRTSLPRVYAAGDVTGGVRQIATATGQGALVVMSIFEDLKRREHPVE